MSKLNSLYTPLQDKTLWSGRADALEQDYLFQVVQFLDLDNPIPTQLSGYGLLGFQSDEGVRRNLGNPGAIEGPDAFRQAVGKLPIHKRVSFYDAGNVTCIDHNLEAAQTELKKRVAMLLSSGLIPIVIGGGHETAWGHFQGIATHYEEVAILNFDAHFDLRPLMNHQGNSGTPFRQINDYLKLNHQSFHYYCAGIQPYSNTKHLFEYAKANQVQYLLAERIMSNPYDMKWITEIIKRHKHIYVSVCLDVFQASIAPGVSAPQPLGISPIFVIEALKLLSQSNKVVSLDIVELAPAYDLRQLTAKLAGLLCMTYCHGL